MNDNKHVKNNSELVSGLFSHGFEVSGLSPCGIKEDWWVSGEPSFFEEYYKTASSNYEAVYVQVKGMKSELGKYGHLGMYDRTFQVIELIEMRKRQEGDCID